MKDRTLILIPCSRTKRSGGDETYSTEHGLCSGALLPPEARELLRGTRHQVWEWVRSSTDAVCGVPLSRLPDNADIRYGSDFGGSENARYLPAATRYAARMYRELCEGSGEPRTSPLLSTDHHVLIISGLYGLVLPEESIQLYNCPLDRKLRSFRFWTQEKAMTRVLAAYVDRHRIERVFDLLCVADYLSVVDWPTVEDAVGAGGVLHCHGQVAADEALLVPAAKLLRDRLLPADEAELLAMGPGETIIEGGEELLLSPRLGSPFDPREEQAACRPE